MKQNTKQIIGNILIPLAVGGAASLISNSAMKNFEKLNQPPLSPPSWLFPVVWTILYVLMGISSYLIAREGRDREDVKSALFTYGLQLFFNFAWTIIFFNFGWYLFAFVWLIALWVLVIRMIMQFKPINKTAAYINIPYLLWITFAAYLNLGIYLLN